MDEWCPAWEADLAHSAELAELPQLLPWNRGLQADYTRQRRWRGGDGCPLPQRGTACVNMILKRLTGERPSTVLAWHRVAEGTPHNAGVGWRRSKLHGGRSPQRQAQRNAAGRQRGDGKYQPGESGPDAVLLLAPPSPRTAKRQHQH